MGACASKPGTPQDDERLETANSERPHILEHSMSRGRLDMEMSYLPPHRLDMQASCAQMLDPGRCNAVVGAMEPYEPRDGQQMIGGAMEPYDAGRLDAEASEDSDPRRCDAENTVGVGIEDSYDPWRCNAVVGEMEPYDDEAPRAQMIGGELEYEAPREQMIGGAMEPPRMQMQGGARRAPRAVGGKAPRIQMATAAYRRCPRDEQLAAAGGPKATTRRNFLVTVEELVGPADPAAWRQEFTDALVASCEAAGATARAEEGRARSAEANIAHFLRTEGNGKLGRQIDAMVRADWPQDDAEAVRLLTIHCIPAVRAALAEPGRNGQPDLAASCHKLAAALTARAAQMPESAVAPPLYIAMKGRTLPDGQGLLPGLRNIDWGFANLEEADATGFKGLTSFAPQAAFHPWCSHLAFTPCIHTIFC